MPSYVVTGSSRGLGLGFIKTLAVEPNNVVFATIRSRATAEQLLEFLEGHPHKNVHVLEADNNDQRALQAAADGVSKVTGGTLDVLINNSALMAYERSSTTIDAFPSPDVLEEDLLLFFKTNTIGPIHTMNAFLPLLRAGSTKKCITITSTVGSPKMASTIGLDTQVGYSISKAAVNLAIAKFAARFREEGIVFLGVTPGMVLTMPWTEEQVEAFLGPITAKLKKTYPNFEGPISVEKSINELLQFVDKCTIADSGKLVHRNGEDFNTL